MHKQKANRMSDAKALEHFLDNEASTKRSCFRVTGKISEDSEQVLYMHARIASDANSGGCGGSRTISFCFDCRSDSPRDVAREMVQEFGWSPDGEHAIATAIQDEVTALTSSFSDESLQQCPKRSVSTQSADSFVEGFVRDLSSEIMTIEQEIEELCRHHQQEESEMRERHKEALQTVKKKLEQTKINLVTKPRNLVCYVL